MTLFTLYEELVDKFEISEGPNLWGIFNKNIVKASSDC